MIIRLAKEGAADTSERTDIHQVPAAANPPAPVVVWGSLRGQARRRRRQHWDLTYACVNKLVNSYVTLVRSPVPDDSSAVAVSEQYNQTVNRTCSAQLHDHENPVSREKFRSLICCTISIGAPQTSRWITAKSIFRRTFHCYLQGVQTPQSHLLDIAKRQFLVRCIRGQLQRSGTAALISFCISSVPLLRVISSPDPAAAITTALTQRIVGSSLQNDPLFIFVRRPIASNNSEWKNLAGKLYIFRVLVTWLPLPIAD
eukprot:284818412_4